MIETSVVYICTPGPARGFVGCGALIEGGYIATCRHVWLDAAPSGDDNDGIVVDVVFPYALDDNNAAIATSAELVNSCEGLGGKPPDLVILRPKIIPSRVMILQLARSERFETGEAIALAGLPDLGSDGPMGISISPIDGYLSATIGPNGLRQFKGNAATTLWPDHGSSGSPLHLPNGQQLAGLVAQSFAGVNKGQSHLRLAYVVPATRIREHLVAIESEAVAREEQLSASQLKEILRTIGAEDVPVSEIPARIRQFVDSSRAYAAEPASATNLGNDVDAAVEASRALVGQLKPEAALALLREKLDEAREVHARRTIPLLKEQATIRQFAFDHEGARATLEEIVRLDPSEIWAWFELGDLWRIAGDLAQAEGAYRSGQQAAIETGDERDLSVSHDRIGDVLVTQGDGAGALADYRKGLAIGEALSARDPSNTLWQRDLSVSHIKIGDVLVAQGDGSGALADYRTGLAIGEALSARDPANTLWQRDLSVSHNRIGDVLVAQGDGSGALADYRTGLAIAEALSARDPSNTEWQRDLLVSHNKIGDVLVAQGDGSGALADYRTGLAIAEALSARDPSNTEWQRDLSVSHDRIGDVLVAQGDGSGALADYRTGLAIGEALSARDPANTEWQRDLSVSHDRIGDVLRAQGDGAGALAAYRTGLAIRETLSARDPSNTEWQRDLSVSHNKVGDVLAAQGDGAGALAAYRTGLAIRETLSARDPSNTEWQRDLSVSHVKIGDVLVALGDGPGALAAYRTGLAIAEALSARDPSNTEWQRDLSVSHNKVGDVLVAQGDGSGALAAYRTGLTIGEALSARDPSNTEWQRDLIVSCVKLAEVSPDQGRPHLERAQGICLALHASGRLNPVDHWMVDDLAARIAALPA